MRLSLAFILVISLVALFAYPLSPDDSPNANRMIPELSAKAPGFSKLFLKLPLQTGATSGTPWLRTVATGRPPLYRLLPVNSFFFARDSIIVAHYIDKGKQETLSFLISDLLPPTMQQQALGGQQMAVFNDALVTRRFYLGTDRYGRDVLSRLILGSRVSLAAGFTAMLLSMAIGIILGIAAGYYRGWVDRILLYLTDVHWAVAGLLLVFAITLSFGRGFWQLVIAIALIMWPGTARSIRGQVIALQQLDYITAAKTQGLTNTRIIFRHILPNLAGLLLSIAAANLASAVLIEAGLSFLGLGVQPPVPLWGALLREYLGLLPTGSLLPVLVPGILITALAGAFNVLSHALRQLQDESRRSGF